MAPIPGKINPFEIENVLNKMFSPEWLRDTATKVGYVQRNRKIDPVTFFLGRSARFWSWSAAYPRLIKKGLRDSIG